MRGLMAFTLPLVCIGILSCSPTTLPAEYRNIRVPEEQLSSFEAQERGRVAFLKSCSICHGETGNGHGGRTDLSGQPANLTDPLWREQSTPRWIFYVIREGVRHTSMGSLKDILSVEETWDIVAYILEEKGQGTEQ